MAEGAPLLREYAVYPASRVRIPPSPPALVAVLAALILPALPAHAGVGHPESTTIEKPGSGPRKVRIRILDKMTDLKVIMRFPMDVTVPLPGGVYRLRVERYTGDFVLGEPPTGRKIPTGETEAGEEGDPGTESGEGASDPLAGKKSAAGELRPVPRREGQSNPAVFVRLFHGEDPVSATWLFKTHPQLFQPSNMRYTFALLGARSPRENNEKRP